ncbi:MAG: hypothetical protein A2048_04580 [Deltaproteobacteria bacterium GWA2_45_12]|nr:MAG: hypothetical protein A2048_04580 [Deltaproteobacteria bacterium GWA2_45_12]
MTVENKPSPTALGTTIADQSVNTENPQVKAGLDHRGEALTSLAGLPLEAVASFLEDTVDYLGFIQRGGVSKEESCQAERQATYVQACRNFGDANTEDATDRICREQGGVSSCHPIPEECNDMGAMARILCDVLERAASLGHREHLPQKLVAALTNINGRNDEIFNLKFMSEVEDQPPTRTVLG